MSEIVILGCGPSLAFYRPESHPGAHVLAINAAAVVYRADAWIAYDHQALYAYAPRVPDGVPLYSLRRNKHVERGVRDFHAFELYSQSPPQGSGHMALVLAQALWEELDRPSVVVYGLDFSELYAPGEPSESLGFQYASCFHGIMNHSAVRDRIAPVDSSRLRSRFTTWPNYRKQMRAIGELFALHRTFAKAIDSRGLFELNLIDVCGVDHGWKRAHKEWKDLK